MNNVFSSFLISVSLLLFNNCQEIKSQIKNNENSEVQNDTLDAYFTKLHKAKLFNGAVAIKRKGKVIFKKGYGFANMEKQTSFLPSTAMEIASVSKQFTATAILLLQQDHKLKITDPIANYLGTSFPYKNITIQHLLTHTSGLPDYESYFKKNWDSTKIAYNKDILDFFKKNHPAIVSAPGNKYQYSNTGYILLAEIVNAASGITLEQYLHEKIFKPMKMDQTFFIGRDSIWNKADYAPAYMIDIRNCNYVAPETLPNKKYYHFLSGRLGSGRLSSSIDDLIKWDDFLYNSEILNSESKELAFTPHPPTAEKSDYGFGWHVLYDSANGKTVYHTGSWAGNLTYIKRTLNSKNLVVLLNNSNSPYMKEIRTTLDGFLLGKALEFPSIKGEELFQNQACFLAPESIQSWYKANQYAKWDVKKLRVLQKEYLAFGENSKSKLLQLLIEQIDKDAKK